MASFRLLNRDGSMNVVRDGCKKLPLADAYHSLLSISWTRFFAVVFGAYFAINLLFGAAFYICGFGAFEGMRHDSASRHFLECFFFSVQTLATIGYGHVSPAALTSNILVTFEALAGMMSLALMTGLLFARFARPTARVLFSDNALITMHDGVLSLIFRIANERLNQIGEARISVVMIRTATTKEGEQYRDLFDLKVDRNYSPMFGLTWTVVHPIDASSPLYGWTEKHLRDADAEILVTLSGLDETFAQTIQARFSYTVEDIRWNVQFVDMLNRVNGKIHVSLHRIHQLQ